MKPKRKLWKYEKHYRLKDYYLVEGIKDIYEDELYRPRFLQLEDAKEYGEARLKTKTNIGYRVWLVNNKNAIITEKVFEVIK